MAAQAGEESRGWHRQESRIWWHRVQVYGTRGVSVVPFYQLLLYAILSQQYSRIVCSCYCK